MKHRLCIVGYEPVIEIAKEVATEFKQVAKFLFITSLMEKALRLLREVEGTAHIVLAGPSTRRMYAGQLKVPVIAFRPTFPDLIRAILEAKRINTRIGVCLSRDDRDFDIPLVSRIMKVSLFPFYCDSSREYAEACRKARDKGLQVVIGGSFTVAAASKIGLHGILLYKGRDMIRTAIINALEICEMRRDEAKRVSQLNALVNHFGEGLLLTDEKGRVLIDNPLAQSLLGAQELKGQHIENLLKSTVAGRVLQQGKNATSVLESCNLVVDYAVIGPKGGGHGLICTLRRVDKIQAAEFMVRKSLHARGFSAKYSLRDIIGPSREIERCRREIAIFAKAPDPILITGESGTGKELFTHAAHLLSDRRNGPFVALNCATLPTELLESELFGYEKGAFTGAHSSGKRGLVEMAHRGTLFLDEVTTLGWPLQAKLLRLLSEREFLKLGSDRIIPIDVRIIAATNVNIEAAVEQRVFREDLYFRLSVLRLHLPALRERIEDIFPLFLHFIARLKPALLEGVRRHEDEIQDILRRMAWKGNARELENIARRFSLLAGNVDRTSAYGRLLYQCLGTRPPRITVQVPARPIRGLRANLESDERRLLEDTIRLHPTRTAAAQALGISSSTLWRRLKKCRIEP